VDVLPKRPHTTVTALTAVDAVPRVLRERLDVLITEHGADTIRDAVAAIAAHDDAQAALLGNVTRVLDGVALTEATQREIERALRDYVVPTP